MSWTERCGGAQWLNSPLCDGLQLLYTHGSSGDTEAVVEGQSLANVMLTCCDPPESKQASSTIL